MTVGANIKHYKILSRIGEGGMGVVYLAEETTLHRKIALKLPSEEFTKDEARAASALNHPNIITIFEIGVSGSLHFIATEFIDGETLRERSDRESLAMREAISIAISKRTRGSTGFARTRDFRLAQARRPSIVLYS